MNGQPTDNGHAVLWRAWRHYGDAEFVGALFDELGEEKTSRKAALVLVAIGAAYGSLAGLALALLPADGEGPGDRPLWHSAWAFSGCGAVLGALAALLFRLALGSRLTWRWWLFLLLPSAWHPSALVSEVLAGTSYWGGRRQWVRLLGSSYVACVFEPLRVLLDLTAILLLSFRVLLLAPVALAAYALSSAGDSAGQQTQLTYATLLASGLLLLLLIWTALRPVTEWACRLLQLSSPGLIVGGCMAAFTALLSGLLGGSAEGGRAGLRVGLLVGAAALGYYLVIGLVGVTAGAFFGADDDGSVWDARRLQRHGCFWWRRAPHPAQVLAAMSRLTSASWSACLSGVENERGSPPLAAALVRGLSAPTWEERFMARYLLCTMDKEALEALDRPPPGEPDREQEFHRLAEWVCEATAPSAGGPQALCALCLARFQTIPARCRDRPCVYHGCPVCKFSRFPYHGVETVVAVLDAAMKENEVQHGARLHVNALRWLNDNPSRRKELFDFDCLHIGEANDDDVVRFLLRVRNDMDSARSARCRRGRCLVSRRGLLSENTRRQLSSWFAGVECS